MRTASRTGVSSSRSWRRRLRRVRRAEWLEALVAARIPCGAVNELPDVLEHPQLRHNRLVVEVDSPAGPLPTIGNPFLVGGDRPALGPGPRSASTRTRCSRSSASRLGSRATRGSSGRRRALPARHDSTPSSPRWSRVMSPAVQQGLEVVADCPLRESERLDQMADARLSAGLRLDQAEDSKPSRLSQDPEEAGELVRLSLIEGPLEERRARGGDGGDGFHLVNRH